MKRAQVTAFIRPVLLSLGRLILNGALGIGMVVALWSGLAWYLENLSEAELKNDLVREIVPYPQQVWEALQKEQIQEALELHLEASTRRILRGMFLATITAYPLGLMLGQSKFLNRLFAPALGLLYPIPKVVFLPVILVLFGIGDDSKVALVVLVLFFQILIVVRDEALDISAELIQSVRSLGAGRRALYRYVYIPASLGAILTAWRISVGTAVAVLFIAETSAGQEGLGYYIVNSGVRLRYPQMYAGILVMSLLGVGLYIFTDILERLFRRWKYVK